MLSEPQRNCWECSTERFFNSLERTGPFEYTLERRGGLVGGATLKESITPLDCQSNGYILFWTRMQLAHRPTIPKNTTGTYRRSTDRNGETQHQLG
jgi:hypothetical protein